MVAGNRNLQADVDELRRSAMSARAQMMVEQATKEQDIAARQDALRARQRSAEHAARDTAVEAAKAVEASQNVEEFDKSLLRDFEAAKASGDLARAEELWEQHLGVSTDFEVTRGRAARLSNEAKQHAAEAAALTEPIREVDRELTRLARALHAAEDEVDNLDKKALLLEQAEKKFAEAEANANPDAQREAQALLEQAEAITVDEAKIEAVEDLLALALALLLEHRAAREDDVVARAVELDDLALDVGVDEDVEVGDAADVDERGGQEAAHPEVDDQAALDHFDDVADRLARRSQPPPRCAATPSRSGRASWT